MVSTKQTEKSRFHSLLGDYWITDAQYVNEYICLKKARYLKKDLPPHPTRHKEWKAFFMRNLRVIHKVLELYDTEAVIAALKNSGYKWSLHTEFMANLIEQEQKKIDDKKDRLEQTPTIVANMDTLTSVPPPRFNALKKLLDIDDE